jgi:hypothetical protein
LERSSHLTVDGTRGTFYAWLIEGDRHGTQEDEEESGEEDSVARKEEGRAQDA